MKVKDIVASLPHWMVANKYFRSQTVEEGKFGSGDNFATDSRECSIEDANLISSEVADGVHYPVIDLDVEFEIIPSSTPGHGHLYINKQMSWEKYLELLEVMRECGIIQAGVLKAAAIQGRTQVRLPHVRKPDEVVQQEIAKKGQFY